RRAGRRSPSRAASLEEALELNLRPSAGAWLGRLRQLAFREELAELGELGEQRPRRLAVRGEEQRATLPGPRRSGRRSAAPRQPPEHEVAARERVRRAAFADPIDRPRAHDEDAGYRRAFLDDDFAFGAAVKPQPLRRTDARRFVEVAER